MNREFRQQKILDLLAQKPLLTIAEIRQLFNVSAMTIHRDLIELEEKNLVYRMRGSVLRKQKSLIDALESCAYCGRELPYRTQVTLIDSSDRKTRACCSHCGFNMIRNQEIQSALGVDFLYGTVIDLQNACFLAKSSVRTCCEPSILVFANPEDALRMQQGFGGEMLGFEKVWQLITRGSI